MLPMLKVSGPVEPERMTAGSATEPCSTLPVRLNCCCKIVDLPKEGQSLAGKGAPHPLSSSPWGALPLQHFPHAWEQGWAPPPIPQKATLPHPPATLMPDELLWGPQKLASP